LNVSILIYNLLDSINTNRKPVETAPPTALKYEIEANVEKTVVFLEYRY